MGSVLATAHHNQSTLQTVVCKRQMKTSMEVHMYSQDLGG